MPLPRHLDTVCHEGHPLGDRFLGYRHDLDELVAFIIEHTRPGLGLEPIMQLLRDIYQSTRLSSNGTFRGHMHEF